MSSKAKQKWNKVADFDDSVWNVKTITVLLLVLVCLGLFIFGMSKLRQSRVASIPAEFEGPIVEKRLSFNEREEGTYPNFGLLVEVDGKRFIVPVYKEIYEEAQVGMRLKRSAKGLEVIRR